MHQLFELLPPNAGAAAGPRTPEQQEADAAFAAGGFRCTARVTLSGPAGQAGSERMPIWNVTSERPHSGGDVTRGARAGGGEEIVTRTWATGDTRVEETNTSHGERHLYEWLMRNQPEEFRSRVVAIELENDPFTPCSACTDILVPLLRALPNVRAATLRWSVPYVTGGSRSGNATREHHIGALVRAGWVLHPAPGEFLRRYNAIMNPE
jgi:hypothetical protein